MKWTCFFSRKIKVGFGPIRTGEDDLAERKWRIDPIIDGINKSRGRYVAGFFNHPHEMGRFDLVVLVKKINPEFVEEMGRLKRCRFIYDIVDNPNDEMRYRYYFKTLPGFLNRIDGFILSTPVYAPWIGQFQKPSLLIEHPILNQIYKTDYREKGEVRILAQGYFLNIQNLQWLEPMLPLLSDQIGKPVRLYYHSEMVKPDREHVRYLKWEVENCFEAMRWADVAITMKDLHKPHQYTKPSTKVIAYMAAALPVICKPTAADRLVMQHKITGFFAYREEDWICYLKRLGSNRNLRRQIGRAARNSVLQRYSINHILTKYFSILDAVN